MSGDKAGQGVPEEVTGSSEVERPEDYLESTLLEIHELISDIENPFTLVGKLVSSLGKDKTLEILTGEQKDEPKKDRGRDPPGSSFSAFANVPRKFDESLSKEGQRREEKQSPVSSDHNASPTNSKSDYSSGKDYLNKGAPGSEPRQSSEQGEKTWGGEVAAGKLPQSPGTGLLPMRNALDDSVVSSANVEPSHQDQDDPLLHFPSPLTLQRDSLGGDLGLQGGGQSFNDNLELAQKLNSLELASVLATIFGKDGSIEVLGCYAKRNWVEEEVARLILDAVTLLGKVDGSRVGQGVKEASTQDHKIALYLIQQYSRSLMSSQESAKFQDQLAIIKSVLDLSPKPAPAPAFREQGDLR